MSKSISLSAAEYRWALQHIANLKNGIHVEYLPSGPNDPAQTVLSKALDLEQKLNAIDERMNTEGCDVILWFIRKYQMQEGLQLAV